MGAALLGRQGQVRDAVVLDHLAPPDPPGKLDHLTGTAQRAVVTAAVPALDDLGSRGADAEESASAAEGVESGRGLGDQRGSPRVDVEDGRADPHPLGPRGEVSHDRRGVETVGLGDPDGVEARGLQGSRTVGGDARIAGVRQR